MKVWRKLCSTINRKSDITNASRGTANAWHFYYTLVFVVTVLCGNFVEALAAP
ncbi:DUF3265 domain-containing protein [Vibrio cholerae]